MSKGRKNPDSNRPDQRYASGRLSKRMTRARPLRGRWRADNTRRMRTDRRIAQGIPPVDKLSLLLVIEGIEPGAKGSQGLYIAIGARQRTGPGRQLILADFRRNAPIGARPCALREVSDESALAQGARLVRGDVQG